MLETHRNVEALSTLPAGALALLSPIETEQDYDAALEASEVLSKMIREGKNPALVGMFKTLVEHIAAYEEAMYPLPEVPPHEMLAHLMEKHDIRQSELAERLDTTQATVSRLVSGQMKFTVEWIEKLSKALEVDGGIFLAK